MIWFFLVPAIFLLLGLADMPIGYYTFMRIVVFLASAFFALVSYKERDKIDFWTVVFGLVAILFNPIIPVYLHDKDASAVFDVIGAITFIIKGVLVSKKLR